MRLASQSGSRFSKSYRSRSSPEKQLTERDTVTRINPETPRTVHLMLAVDDESSFPAGRHPRLTTSIELNKVQTSMTFQVPEQITSQLPGINFRPWSLAAVIEGDFRTGDGWGTPYIFAAKPKPITPVSTACQRGHQMCFRLTRNGDLVLELYEYPFSKEAPTEVDEKLSGDFFLVFWEGERNGPFGSPQARRIYVPFRSGKIVVDTAQWAKEPPYRRIFERGHNRKRKPQTAALQSTTSKVVCPGCGLTFSVRSEISWDGVRHRCGQQIELRCDGVTLSTDVQEQRRKLGVPFDFARVLDRSRSMLSKLSDGKDGQTTTGDCPNCGLHDELRICASADRRIVLCYSCYFSIPRASWQPDS